MSDERTLHLYAQAYWHDTAVILGNRAAIEALRALCDKALESTKVTDEFMTEDGEGYDLRIVCTDDAAILSKAQLPYTDEVAIDWRDGKIIP